jgi:phosphoglycerate dehydrogenase-like enzyme
VKVVFHFAAGAELAAQLAAQQANGLDVVVVAENDEAGLTAALPDAAVLWHVLKPCTAEIIAAAPKLRLIQKIGVGVNTIDLDAARARGIAVCNLPGTNAPAVADLT